MGPCCVVCVHLQSKGTTGITTNLEHRMKQHKAELLYSEDFLDKRDAAKREREIKGWRREKKLALIKKMSR